MYTVVCSYRPGGAAERFKHRVAHLEYVIAAGSTIAFGGAMHDEVGGSGDGATGALFVLDVRDRAAVQRFLADEPYFRAGLFESVSIRTFRQMNPEPRPGLLREELENERRRVAREET